MEKKTILKKHTSAIHCTNSQSLLQRKISNVLLFNAYHNLLSQEEHEITIANLCKLISYAGHNHSAIKDSLKELITTLLEWNLIDENTGEEEWNACSMLASVKLKGALCIYSYSPNLRKLLYNPSVYGKINLIVQARFRSSYGLALYENCIRYYGLPSTRWFEVDVFRKLMGVPEDKYLIFRDFKRRVLDKAVEEVNTYSDMIIKYEIQRVGKKVTKIKFAIKDRPKKTALGSTLIKNENTNKPVNELFLALQQYSISTTVAANLAEVYGEAYVRDKLKLVSESLAYKNGKIRDVAGYLINAIKNDYKEPVSSHVISNDETRYNEASLKERVELKQKYQKHIIEQTMKAFYALPVEKQELIEGAFIKMLSQDISRTPILVSFKEYRFAHEFNREQFVDFVAFCYPSLQRENVSWEEFIKSSREGKVHVNA